MFMIVWGKWQKKKNMKEPLTCYSHMPVGFPFIYNLHHFLRTRDKALCAPLQCKRKKEEKKRKKGRKDQWSETCGNTMWPYTKTGMRLPMSYHLECWVRKYGHPCKCPQSSTCDHSAPLQCARHHPTHHPSHPREDIQTSVSVILTSMHSIHQEDIKTSVSVILTSMRSIHQEDIQTSVSVILTSMCSIHQEDIQTSVSVILTSMHRIHHPIPGWARSHEKTSKNFNECYPNLYV